VEAMDAYLPTQDKKYKQEFLLPLTYRIPMFSGKNQKKCDFFWFSYLFPWPFDSAWPWWLYWRSPGSSTAVLHLRKRGKILS